MARWIKVRALDDALVPNPHAPDAVPHRYVGKTRLERMPDDAEGNHHERYAATEEVLLDVREIRRAVDEGHLELLGACDAKTHAEATAKMLAAPAKKVGDL